MPPVTGAELREKADRILAAHESGLQRQASSDGELIAEIPGGPASVMTIVKFVRPKGRFFLKFSFWGIGREGRRYALKGLGMSIDSPMVPHIAVALAGLLDDMVRPPASAGRPPEGAPGSPPAIPGGET